MISSPGNNGLAPPDPPSTGEKAINAKHKALRTAGLDLGPAQSPHRSEGDDGLMRVYERGNIYWSPQTGAHEVHGGILKKYLLQGEAGVDPVTGRRLFGFPVTDEVRTGDPRSAVPVSYFQEGAIFWVRGVGAVNVTGPFYSGQHKPVVENFPSALPIADPVEVAGGQALHFGHYTLYAGPATEGEIIEVFLTWPSIGTPWILRPKSPFPLSMVVRVVEGAWDGIQRRQPDLLARIIGNRYLFRSVGTKKVVAIAPAGPPAKVAATVLRGLAAVPLQALGDWTERAPEILKAVQGDLSETKIGTQTVKVLSFPSSPGAGRGTPPEGVQFKMVSTNQLNNAPTFEDPLLPVDPPLPPPDPPSPTDILRFTLDMEVVGTKKLENRTLYDVGFRVDAGTVHVVAPHGAYAKRDWSDFGFMHATDIHVSRRIDRFAEMLRAAGKNEGADSLNNWNDAFRDFIRYANHLHALNLLDVILATGDVVDYEYEWAPNQHEPQDRSALYSWDPKGGETSNWDFLRQLLLGRVPYPEGAADLHEELRVPIFVTLGNHDYRSKPYSLRADADKLTVNLKEIEQYSGFNLTLAEAKSLVGGSIPSISLAEAAKAIYAPDKYISAMGHPVNLVALGPHRIVMLDTGRDAGLPEDDLDALLAVAGFNNEDKNNLVDAAPNSMGIADYELDLVKRALQEAGDDGLVIVGLHAPPLNTKGTEFPHYFRETEHATADAREIVAYLLRQGGFFSQSARNEWQLVLKNLGSVSPVNMDHWELRRTDHFKSGGIDNLLDWSIASRLEGETLPFLKLCAGEGSPAGRAVDLVLFGHVHRNVEYRLEWDEATQELLYFMDFYSENPAAYYKSNKIDFEEKVHLRVRDVPEAGAVRTVTDNRPGAFWNKWLEMDIPRYDDSLDESLDPTAWWDKHRPLLFQTGALGPGSNHREDKSENENKPGPSFQGFRYFKVRGNKIVKMRYVTMSSLRENDFAMPWEKASPLDGLKDHLDAGPGGGVLAPD